MVMPKPIRYLYEFGSFRLDAKERILTCEGKAIPLAPKVFDTLFVLVENRGSVLEKEVLLKILWPDTIVEESNLTTYISQIRKALGENGSEQNFIETIPRRGYRFVATVKEISLDYEGVLRPQPHGRDIVIGDEIRVPVNGTHHFVTPPTVDAVALPNPVPHAEFSFTKFFRRHPLLLGLAGIIILAGALILAWQKWFFKTTPPFQNIVISKVTTNGRAPLATISPDGKYVAYVIREMPNQSLWLRQTATTSNVQIVAPTATQFLPPTFSPDGTQIFYVVYEKNIPDKNAVEGVLYQIPTLGGTPHKILSDVDSQVTISPDGKQIAFVRSDLEKMEQHLIVANIDGTAERKLLTRKTESGFSTPAGPAWSPDGKLLACTVNINVPGDTHMSLITIAVQAGIVTTIKGQKWHWAGQIAWTKDGAGMIVNAWHLGAKTIADQIWFVPYPDGEAQQITNDVNNYQGLSYATAAHSFVTVQAMRLSRIWILPAADSARAMPITSGLGDSYGEFLGLTWTPEGKILYGSQAAGNSDVWVMDMDGKNQKQLTTDTLSDVAPSISADGKIIVYSSYREGVPHLWKMNADGSDPQQLTKGAGEFDASISPDGNWVVYLEDGKNQKTLWKIPLQGGTPQEISHLNISRAVISPDGKSIACIVWNDEQKKRLWQILSFADGKVLKIITPKKTLRPGQFRWTSDSRALTYILTENEVSNIWRQPIDGSEARPITKFTNDLIFRFAWSVDGKNLAIERGVNVNDIIWVKEQR